MGMTQIRNVMPEKNYPSYSVEWEKINQLQSQGLIKDVINQVELLLARAERENNLLYCFYQRHYKFGVTQTV